MRRTITADVRPDAGKATRFRASAQSIGGFELTLQPFPIVARRAWKPLAIVRKKRRSREELGRRRSGRCARTAHGTVGAVSPAIRPFSDFDSAGSSMTKNRPPRPFWLREHFGPDRVPCWLRSPKIE